MGWGAGERLCCRTGQGEGGAGEGQDGGAAATGPERQVRAVVSCGGGRDAPLE